jgi:hypothetical protein
MALNVTTLVAELDSIVAQATSYADLVTKYADAAAGFIGKLPVVGPDAEKVVALIDAVDKALDALNAALNPTP